MLFVLYFLFLLFFKLIIGFYVNSFDFCDIWMYDSVNLWFSDLDNILKFVIDIRLL